MTLTSNATNLEPEFLVATSSFVDFLKTNRLSLFGNVPLEFIPRMLRKDLRTGEDVEETQDKGTFKGGYYGVDADLVGCRYTFNLDVCSSKFFKLTKKSILSLKIILIVKYTGRKPTPEAYSAMNSEISIDFDASFEKQPLILAQLEDLKKQVSRTFSLSPKKIKIM